MTAGRWFALSLLLLATCLVAGVVIADLFGIDDFGSPWVFRLVVGSFVVGVLTYAFVVVPRRYAADG